MRSLNFKCAAETRARLKKPLADLKRKTRRIHSHLKMINRLIDDRDRLARAKERIAELERIADRSPREWGEIVAYGKRQVAAQRIPLPISSRGLCGSTVSRANDQNA